MSALQETLLLLTENFTDEKMEQVIKFVEFMSVEEREEAYFNKLADESEKDQESFKLDDVVAEMGYNVDELRG